ncbi:MAG: efflux RND transporter periplasmic adaptor subunit [Phaeodactylibacter sp.]|nr:efflux RND transporter periplasmic adaptor subunit [Phaeodactylibacter sp.]MCB9272887.1 efflux RND transporter periplasmic adaptor subunit [Lewinellaceae bacterium]
MSKRTTRIVSLLAIVILAIVFLLFQADILGTKKTGPEQEKADAAGPPAGAQQALSVEAMVAQPTVLKDDISVNGSTAPDEEVSVASEVPGKIQKILFREGTEVKRGAALVELDTEELRAERKRLSVQQALNEKIAERLKALYDKEGVSLQEYEVAEAEVDKVKAEIALVDAQLEKRIIRAPFNGRLGLRLVSEGTYLAPGTPIVSLVSTNPIKLEFDVPEKYAREISSGTNVEFRLDGSDRSYHATITAKEPNVDAETRTLRLKASAPNPDGSILPGAFAKVTVSLHQFDNTIMVPTQSVVPELNSQKVFVVRQGKAEPVDVETGIRREAFIQIKAGLNPGDTVITTGVLQARPGADIIISKLN